MLRSGKLSLPTADLLQQTLLSLPIA